jgi:DNA-binding beta-propeller fold protein YncE
LLWANINTEPPKSLLDLPYSLGEPTHKYKLDNKLQEISALGWVAPGKLYCVDDEEGILYTYDLQANEISAKARFWKDKDFEGIEAARQDVWALKSNGSLYKISHGKKDGKEYTTFLNDGNDTEGLAYQADKNRLLIACKGVPADKSTDTKAIYAFDLNEEKLLKEPAYTISLDQLEMYKAMNPVIKAIKGIQDFFSPGSNLSFQPSGIAVQPNSGDLYIISSVGKLLVVLDMNGNIQHIESLDPEVFKQPEGIAFSANGRKLYISNEGRGGTANILEFDFLGQ